MTKILVIASGKGGVGKTTAALNIGTALAQYGRNTVVVDADLRNPSIALYLGSPNLKSTINEVLKGKAHISQVAYMHPSGLRIIPASIKHEDTFEPDTERIGHVIADLHGLCEIVIVDIGNIHESTSLLRSCDGVLIVTSPNIIDIADALRAIKSIEMHGGKVIGVMLNKVRNDDIEMDIKSVESLLEKRVIAVIPEDNAVRRSVHLKHPVVYLSPDAESSQGYKKLAKLLIEGKS